MAKAVSIAAAALLLAATITVVLKDQGDYRTVLSTRESKAFIDQGLKLSYNGPLYAGDGTWVNDASKIEDRPPVETRRSRFSSSSRGHLLERTGDSESSLMGGAIRRPSTHTARSVQHARPQGARMKQASHKQVPKIVTPSRSAHVQKGLPPSVIGGLSDFSSGFSKIWDLHDNRVHMKSPVKILNHV